MHITVLGIMMPLLYMTGEKIGAEYADLIAPVLRHKTVKYEFHIPESSNQNIVYTGLNVLIGRYFECEYKLVLGKFNAGNVLPQRSSFFSRVLEEENQSEHCIQYINCSDWTILEYKYEICSKRFFGVFFHFIILYM